MIKGGGRKPLNCETKMILGKERCIYKKSNSSKEYVKYKGKLVTISEFIELNKKISKTKTKKNSKTKTKNSKIKLLQSVLRRKLQKKPKNLHVNIFLKDVIKAESKTPIFKEISKTTSKTKKNSKARRIQRFLRDKLIKNKYTLDNRVRFAKYLKSRLTDIKENDCIETKTFKNGSKGYTIKNVIDLVKKIGTESVYGSIYLSSIKESLGGYSIVTKVMENIDDNNIEIELMIKLTNELLLTKKSKHFAAVYNYAKCLKDSIIDYDGTKKIRQNKHKLVSINELAHGDLKTLVEKKEILNNEKLLFNLLIQVFISIGTFQSHLNYVHRDAHYGNFLYQKNNDIGYYQYKFGNMTFYLKSSGYNIIIYDYGLSRPENKFTNREIGSYLLRDYYRITHAFLSKMNGWGIYSNLPNKKTEDIILNFKNDISRYSFITKDEDKTFPQYVFQTLMFKLFYTLDSKTSLKDDLYTFKTPNNIINKEPFIIY